MKTVSYLFVWFLLRYIILYEIINKLFSLLSVRHRADLPTGVIPGEFLVFFVVNVFLIIRVYPWLIFSLRLSVFVANFYLLSSLCLPPHQVWPPWYIYSIAFLLPARLRYRSLRLKE
jgi:hypothetical protein